MKLRFKETFVGKVVDKRPTSTPVWMSSDAIEGW